MNDNNYKFLFTIGHSNHPISQFIEILKKHNITAIADVRSIPYSAFNQQFNREYLAKNLKNFDIAYVFLGEELGAKPDDLFYYKDGQVDLTLISMSEKFKQGIERLIRGTEKYRIALMCSEKDPINCHRAILIAPFLQKLGVTVKHILYNGSIEEHSKTENRIINLLKQECDLFLSSLDESEIVKLAYMEQLKKISHKVKMEE